MASVFRQAGKGKNYYAVWKDHNGTWQRKCTFTRDKEAAKRIASKYETDAALRRDGVIDPCEDRYSVESRRELERHLADYKASLEAKGRDAEYVKQNDARARAIVEACKAKVVADLTASAVQQAISELRDGGASLATCNTYIRSIKGFTKWLARDKRTKADALAFVDGSQA
jgi:hypothetical protein